MTWSREDHLIDKSEPRTTSGLSLAQYFLAPLIYIQVSQFFSSNASQYSPPYYNIFRRTHPLKTVT